MEVKNLSLAFGEKVVLDNFSMTIPDHSITALSGPSGCGKTTLLRCIAGLQKPDSGAVLGISPQDTAILFQENRLLPWRTVREQLTDVLPPQRRDRADQLLKLVGLEDEGDHTPDQLSGGMGRRLALARCLALDARLYLLDEPFAGVDLARSKALMEHLKGLKVPVLLSTHEPEILAKANRVVFMDGLPLKIL